MVGEGRSSLVKIKKDVYCVGTSGGQFACCYEDGCNWNLNYAHDNKPGSGKNTYLLASLLQGAWVKKRSTYIQLSCVGIFI